MSLDLWGTVLEMGDRSAASVWRVREFALVLSRFGYGIPVRTIQAAIDDVISSRSRWQREDGIQTDATGHVDAILAELDVFGDEIRAALVVVHTHANLRACAEPMPGMRQTLSELRSRGVQVVLSSNTLTAPGYVARQILDYHGLTSAFDQLFFSDEVGSAKPHGGFFATVAARVGVPETEILHLGDDWRTDIRGAQAAGWQPVCFNPRGKPHWDAGVFQIQRATDLVPLITALDLIAEAGPRQPECRRVSDLAQLAGPGPAGRRGGAADPVLYTAYRDVLPPRRTGSSSAWSAGTWSADLVVYQPGHLASGEPHRSIGHWNSPGQVEIFQALTGRVVIVTAVVVDGQVAAAQQVCEPGDIAVVPLGAWHVTYVLDGLAAVVNIYADRDEPDHRAKYAGPPGPDLAMLLGSAGPRWQRSGVEVPEPDPATVPSWLDRHLPPGGCLAEFHRSASDDELTALFDDAVGDQP